MRAKINLWKKIPQEVNGEDRAELALVAHYRVYESSDGLITIQRVTRARGRSEASDLTPTEVLRFVNTANAQEAKRKELSP